MKNVETKVEHGKLIITVDLSKELGPSASGKSVIIPPPVSPALGGPASRLFQHC